MTEGTIRFIGQIDRSYLSLLKREKQQEVLPTQAPKFEMNMDDTNRHKSRQGKSQKDSTLHKEL